MGGYGSGRRGGGPTVESEFAFRNAAKLQAQLANAPEGSSSFTYSLLLSTSKLRLELGGFPDICEPMPPKPKWTRQTRPLLPVMTAATRSASFPNGRD